MYLVHVYPLLRGTPLYDLSYFSKTEYPRGTIIDVPIRGKKVPAVVEHAREASAARGEVRRAGYRLTAIPDQAPRLLFLPALLDIAESLADESVGSVGAILHSILPAALFSGKPLPSIHEATQALRAEGAHEELLLQAPHDERIAAYRTLVREYFAKKRSVLLLFPSVREAESASAAIADGLEAGRVHLIHGALPAKVMRGAWTTALERRDPVAIVATISGLSIPRADLGLIIIEREQSDYYIREARPRADARACAAAYARALGIPILFADSVLGVALHAELARTEAAEYRPLKRRMEHTASVSVIDMRGYRQTPRGEYHALSDELRALIQRAERSRERVFILSGRRGLASSVICSDCGVSVACERCGAPVALHTRKDVPVFLCHHCNSLGESAACCRQCSSWKLLALGAGSELIEKQVRRATKLPVFRIDSDATKTPASAALAAEHFELEPSILIGTERAIPFLPQRISHIATTAIDSLLAIPDFALEERLFSLVMTLLERAENTFLIQTRDPAHPLLKNVRTGDTEGFIERELRARRSFGFPPYTILVSLALYGNRQTVTRSVSAIVKKLSRYEPMLLPAQRGARRGTEIVLKVAREAWPDHALLEELRALPPPWDITIRAGGY